MWVKVINGSLDKPVIKSILGPAEPSVSVIMPYKEGEVLNPLNICYNDELIVVLNEKSIGHARIRGVLESTFDWIVSVDSDAVYPDSYITDIKYYIREYEYEIMCATRRGGARHFLAPAHEHGLIVRKEVFLERVEEFYKSDITKAFTGEGRADIGKYFHDAVRIPVKYYHKFTKGEKKGIGYSLLFWLLGL